MMGVEVQQEGENQQGDPGKPGSERWKWGFT